jgi:hypothetical protein
LLAASLIEQVTVVTPFWKSVPEAGEQVGVRLPSQLSLAVALKVTLAVHLFGSVLLMMLVGHVSVGACASLTVTVNEHWLLPPSESVAVQVTVVTPLGKSAPEAGEQTGVMDRSQVSTAATMKVVFAVHLFGSVLLVMLPGHIVKVGGSLCVTVTVSVALVVWDAESVTLSVKLAVFATQVARMSAVTLPFESTPVSVTVTPSEKATELPLTLTVSPAALSSASPTVAI